MRHSIVAALAALLIVPATAHALRVGNDLIRKGDTKLEVLEAMGEPKLKERITTPQGGTWGWRYYYRVNGEQVILHFRRGKVERIERAD